MSNKRRNKKVYFHLTTILTKKNSIFLGINKKGLHSFPYAYFNRIDDIQERAYDE